MITKFKYIFLFLTLLGQLALAQDNPKVEEGILDLRTWDFENKGIISLTGEWEFYWLELIKTDSSHTTPHYIKVPSLWRQHDRELLKFGYASYKMTLLLSDTTEELCLKIPRIASSYELFVNDKKVAALGKVGKNTHMSEPKERIEIVRFVPESSTVELVLQVSNFHQQPSGMRKNLQLGLSKQIDQQNLNKRSLDLILFAILFLMSLFFFILYPIFKTQKAVIYLAIGVFLLSIYTLIIGEGLLFLLFENISWLWTIRFQFIILYLLFPLLANFIAASFPFLFKRNVIQVIWSISSLFILISLVTPSDIFTYLLQVFQYYFLVVIVYIIVLLIIAIIKKTEKSIVFLITLLIITTAIINDILFLETRFTYFSIFNLGGLLFAGIHFAIQLQQFIFMHKQNKALIEESAFITSNLEEIVKIRTQQSELQKEELISLNEQIEEQKAFLQKDNTQIEQQNKRLEHKNNELQEVHNELDVHFQSIKYQQKQITESIRYASQIQLAVLPTIDEISESLTEWLLIFRPKEIVSGDFYWHKKNANCSAIVVADSTGHGVPGALMSMLGMSFLDEIIRNKESYSAGKILDALRSRIKQFLHQSGYILSPKDGMDIALCIIDHENKTLDFSGAYNPMYICRNKEMSHYKADRQPIGIYVKERPFSSEKINYQEGDMVYLHTDGFIDQMGGPRNKKFSSKSFRSLITRIGHENIRDQKTILEETFDRWQGDNSQLDDVTVLGFRL